MSDDTIPRVIVRQAELWVFHKPAGFAVHPTGNPRIPDLLSWAQSEIDAPASLAPVHRLDRATSGVVICSADEKTRGNWGRKFAEGAVEKEYRALVYGHCHKKGVIKRPLEDVRRKQDLEAETRYWRLESFGAASYLKVRPITGRRHQIRRHLQGIGHGILGDKRYHNKRRLRVAGFVPRLWLHCLSLRFDTGEFFEAPLCPRLEAQLEILREVRASKQG
jgi:tRNA pseudouridine65 synthase